MLPILSQRWKWRDWPCSRCTTRPAFRRGAHMGLMGLWARPAWGSSTWAGQWLSSRPGPSRQLRERLRLAKRSSALPSLRRLSNDCKARSTTTTIRTEVATITKAAGPKIARGHVTATMILRMTCLPRQWRENAKTHCMTTEMGALWWEPTSGSLIEVRRIILISWKDRYTTNECLILGESGDSSLVVSLEINSVMYQGVLFAQPTLGNKVSSKESHRGTSNSNKEHQQQKMAKWFLHCSKKKDRIYSTTKFV